MYFRFKFPPRAVSQNIDHIVSLFIGVEEDIVGIVLIHF